MTYSSLNPNIYTSDVYGGQRGGRNDGDDGLSKMVKQWSPRKIMLGRSRLLYIGTLNLILKPTGM